MAPHFSSITIECKFWTVINFMYSDYAGMAYMTLYFGSSPTDASADLTVKRDFISEKYNLVFEPIPVATSSLSHPLASSEYTLIKFLREDFASIQSLCASRKNATAINTINNCQRYLFVSLSLICFPVPACHSYARHMN